MKQENQNTSELDFYSMINVILTPIILTDNHYRHMFRNRCFREQIGYDFAEVYDRQSWLEKAFPDPNYRNEAIRLWDEKLAHAQAEKNPHLQLSIRIYCKDKRYQWYNAHEYQLGRYRIITLINVNHVKTKNEELLKIIKFNNILHAIIAHDIRSPLATLKSLIQFEGEKINDSQDLKRILVRLDNQINRIFDIIDSSVLHHGDELNHFRFKPQKINLNALIEKIQSYYDEEMRGLKKSWITNILAPVNVYYDRFILEVMIRNIVSNAVKFTPSLESIKLSIDQTSMHTDLHVEDKGGGMTEEDLRYLNDPLTYRRTERADIRMGFGIGLLISKDMLESHWGKLIIVSNPPIGTRFTIRIPSFIPESYT